MLCQQHLVNEGGTEIDFFYHDYVHHGEKKLKKNKKTTKLNYSLRYTFKDDTLFDLTITCTSYVLKMKFICERKNVGRYFHKIK